VETALEEGLQGPYLLLGENLQKKKKDLKKKRKL